MASTRVIRDDDGPGWVVEYSTGTFWRILTEIELGFVGSEARPATDEEKAESAKRHYAGISKSQTDPWSQFSPLGRANAFHVADPRGLRLLRNWDD